MTRLWRITGGRRRSSGQARVERDLDAELRAFLETAVDEKMRGGMSRARRRAPRRLEMGSVEAVKDHVRDVGWESDVESVWQDVRYGARTLRRSPGVHRRRGADAGARHRRQHRHLQRRQRRHAAAAARRSPEELIDAAAAVPARRRAVFSYAAYADRERRRSRRRAGGLAVRRDAITFGGPPEPVNTNGSQRQLLRHAGRARRGRAACSGPRRSRGARRAGRGVQRRLLDAALRPRSVGRRPQCPDQGHAFTIVGVAPRGFFGETVGESPDIWIP